MVSSEDCCWAIRGGAVAFRAATVTGRLERGLSDAFLYNRCYLSWLSFRYLSYFALWLSNSTTLDLI